MISLAVKYRPHCWSDVTEQSTITEILQHQILHKETKNAYLFTGPAGCGKTTCARIFANDINGGKGNPIELDAASNSSVEDVRGLLVQARTKSIDSPYKVFIVDECHSLSNTSWQAFLKMLEEPPACSVFVFCTTDPQKIPKTILSRVQRYDFHRISNDGIVKRLTHILNAEQNEQNRFYNIEPDAVSYLAKLASGGMRDAITLLDKCLSFSTELSVKNILQALGISDYDTMFDLYEALNTSNTRRIIAVVESVYTAGKDLKLFIRNFTKFVLDLNKFFITSAYEYIEIPNVYDSRLRQLVQQDTSYASQLLTVLVKLNATIKWDASPLATIEAVLLSEGRK